MGLTRQELLKVRKVKYLAAKIAHKRRTDILRAMQTTMTNQLKAEIAAGRKKAA